jgi:DNA-directed RNA polymerase subunit M/transcription elongation factor TFIIS
MTSDNAVPTNQSCPGCNALVFYEGHSELKTALTPHKFHCHSCGRLYIVRSTSHKQPQFALSERHEATENEAGSEEGHNHEGQNHEGHNHEGIVEDGNSNAEDSTNN